MKVQPYLFFDGSCEDALKFYARVMGGRIDAMMPYKDMPGDEATPPDLQDKIMHARMSIGDQVIMASDASPGRYRKPQGFSVTLNVDQPDEAERLFKELSEGAQDIQMPIGETFWAQRFGALVDRYGTSWMINCEKKM